MTFDDAVVSHEKGFQVEDKLIYFFLCKITSLLTVKVQRRHFETFYQIKCKKGIFCRFKLVGNVAQRQSSAGCFRHLCRLALMCKSHMASSIQVFTDVHFPENLKVKLTRPRFG